MSQLRANDEVGPVFSDRPETAAFLEAILRLNDGARLVNRGSYVRVLARNRCVLTRDAVELAAGQPIRWPEELEALMPSFKGRLTMTGDRAEWTDGPRSAP